MTIWELLAELRRRQIAIWPEEDRLRVAGPAGALSAELRDELAARKPQILRFLREIVDQTVHRPLLEPTASDGPAPLSFAQGWLLLLEEIDTNRTNYLIPLALRLEGPLSVEALAASLAEVVRRHAVLRTSIRVSETGPVAIVERAGAVELPVADWSDLAPAARTARLAAAQADEAARPFDVSRESLLRARLVRLAAEEHVLLLTVHHIAFDDWSLGVLFRELGALYPAYAEGRRPTLAEPRLQYADFARWQHQWLTDGVVAEELEYWRVQLAGAPAVLDLPTDRPRPAVLAGEGALAPLSLPPALVSGLRALSRREEVTLFMVLLAGFQTVLARWSGQTDMVVGVPVAGRSEPALEELIGCFINTLPMRVTLPADLTVRQALARVRETALGAYAHQALPFIRLVEALAPVRDVSRTPLVQVGVDLHNTPAPTLRFGSLQVTPLSPVNRGAKLDVFLILEETAAGGLSGGLEYRPALFDAATMERMAGHLETVLTGMVGDPESRLGALPLLTAAEREELLVCRNATAAPYPEARCVHELIAAQVTRTPERLAVTAADGTLSYAALEAQANRLAQYLRHRGAGPEVRVAVCLERSALLAVALLGILKAGAAFVPLDPDFPAERMRYVLTDSGALMLLTQSALQARVPPTGTVRTICLDTEWTSIEREAPVAPPSTVTATNLCYLIYTSGSTGRPKGVLVSHRALVNHVTAIAGRFGLRPTDTILQFASSGFDVALEEMLPCWCVGARVAMPRETIETIDAFAAHLDEANITVANLPTPYWHAWVEALGSGGAVPPRSLRLLVIGSERALPGTVAAWQHRLDRPVGLINAYGLTEATITSVVSDVPRDFQAGEAVAIGRPIANTRAYVLDGAMGLVPDGVAGELYIGGAGLARGYQGQGALTAERFVPDPYGGDAGARLYRTGDRVRWRVDGQLEFLGRLDEQVKVRGFRVELGEVETVLAGHGAVREAIVVAREDGAGERRLVAYVVPRDAGAAAETMPGRWRAHLEERLPGYMVPSAYVLLDALPLNRNGKVDRAALVALGEGEVRPANGGRYVAPRTPVEELLAGIWAELLGVDRVGREDDFFALGGHSLMAMRVLARVRKATGRDVPLRLLFERPTVAAFASVLDRHVPAATATAGIDSALSPRPVPEQSPEEQSPPLSLAQEPLWALSTRVPNSPHLKLQVTFDLAGPLDPEALSASLSEIVRRHAVLRTTIDPTNRVRFQQVQAAKPVPLPITDLCGLNPAAQNRAVASTQVEDASRCDLTHGPLLHARLLPLSGEQHVLVLTVHHIAFDGWSVGVLIDELASLYPTFAAGLPSSSLPEPPQYADYARWQRRWLTEEAGAAGLAHWELLLKNGPASQRLPTDRSRSTVRTFRYRRRLLTLTDGLYHELRRFGEQTGASLFMVCLSALFVLMFELTGESDLWVASVMAGRGSVELERMIGCFLNTVILRADLTDRPSFREIVRRVRRVVLDAFVHQDVPFDAVAQAIGLKAGDDLSSPIPILFNFEHDHLAALTPMGNVTLTGRATAASHAGQADLEAVIPTLFDFIIDAVDDGKNITMTWKYNSDLFLDSSVERLVERYHTILTMFSKHPDGLLVQQDRLARSDHQVRWVARGER